MSPLVVLALITALSFLCNYAVWQMLRMASFNLCAPTVIADVPDYTFDSRGMV